MSEATELLAWRRGLADTPQRLQRLLSGDPPRREEVLSALVRTEAWALAVLDLLFAAGSDLPAPGDVAPPEGDPLDTFLALRGRTLELLDRVDASTLHWEGRLPSGRPLDPWRLAGELAELDVRHLAALRRS